MAFPTVEMLLLVISTPLNEVFPKLNLPFRKGYSPNKMNKEMLLVHINVILPPSKSVLITVFKKAAWVRRTGTQLPCVGRQLSGGHTKCLSLERQDAMFFCPFPLSCRGTDVPTVRSRGEACVAERCIVNDFSSLISSLDFYPQRY